jgi:MFS superfamily sulfate permease-like transporter
MTVMFRLQKPKVRGLVRMPGTDLYKPVDIYTRACAVPNVKIVRVDAPIYFANAAYIKTRLYNLAGFDSAMSWLRKEKEDTEDVDEKYGAFTNTLAMGDDEPDATEQFRSIAIDRRMSRISTTVSPAPLGREAFKEDDELEKERKKSYPEETASVENFPEIHLIVDCSEVCFMDVTGVSFLKKTAIECKTIGVELLLANTNSKRTSSIFGTPSLPCSHFSIRTPHAGI